MKDMSLWNLSSPEFNITEAFQFDATR